MTTVMYPERMYPDDTEERRIFGPDVRILMRDTHEIADLSDAECAEVEGLMIFRQFLREADIARFPRLRAVVRMGVGYDRLDRQAAAARGVIICNVPDYGTTEVADHTIAMILALRRGLLLHYDAQRATPPAPWVATQNPLIRRIGAQTLGVVGLGRIGTAVALRAKALGFRVVFHDPYLSNGSDLAIGVHRALTLDDLLPQSDVLSLHVPQTAGTIGMIGPRELALLPRNAIVVNAARGRILDLDALQSALQDGHIAGAGLDVIPVEPPVDPLPGLLRAYRAREPWIQGRLIVTPHSAYLSPEAHLDIRIKSAETMRAALLSNHPQNVISPESY